MNLLITLFLTVQQTEPATNETAQKILVGVSIMLLFCYAFGIWLSSVRKDKNDPNSHRGANTPSSTAD